MVDDKLGDELEQVIAQGAGSPRDTLSALELVSNAGGVASEVIGAERIGGGRRLVTPSECLTIRFESERRLDYPRPDEG